MEGRPKTLRRPASARAEDAGVSEGTRFRPALEASLNDSREKVMSGCGVERRYQSEAQEAVEVAKAQESIDLLWDAILPQQVRIAIGHNALGARLVSFRGNRVNAVKVSPGDKSGRVR